MTVWRVVLCSVVLALGVTSSTPKAGLENIEHVVVFMQENRAFDHYYGSLRGVRGFNDPAAPLLPCGKEVWYQSTNETNPEDYILPFHLDFANTSATCMPAPEMAYPSDIGIHHNGSMDRWNSARAPGYGVSYFEREDLPYYYALADAFTIGDQYYQSTFTATNPNRLHLFSGSNGLSVNQSLTGALDDGEPHPGWNWTTMGEILEEAGVSWKVHQEFDNFDDNGFAWFNNYQTAKPGNPLWENGIKPVPFGTLVSSFQEDVKNDALPQVTWIVGPAVWSEHATNHPAAGEALSSRLIAALASNPAVYAKTAFILNYDEGGQFFDHHWVPTPPKSAKDGKSTVTTEGELTKGDYDGQVPAGHPIGLGFRVPLMIISPWTRGGYVYSEVCDHTSVIKFIEERFGVHNPNISPWRRAVVGDLTHAFDFANPDYSWPNLPDTSTYTNASNWQCDNNPPPELPVKQSLPTQEPGTRPSRALPYDFSVSASTSTMGVSLTIKNTGTAGGAFQVYNLLIPSDAPKKYTVQPQMSLDDTWPAPYSTYSLSVHGPNGFVRYFNGSAIENLSADLVRGMDDTVEVVVGGGDCVFKVADNSYGHRRVAAKAGEGPLGPWALRTTTGTKNSLKVDVSPSGRWYDLTVTASCGNDVALPFARRFMGRMENGKDSISDPVIGRPRAGPEPEHPRIPDHFRVLPTFDMAKRCEKSSRQLVKDQCPAVELYDPAIY